jgi:hypothetical protein
MACSDITTTVVTLKGGLAADVNVIARLIDIEARGARFELLEGGRFRVVPPEVLTPEDRRFLADRRDEARRVLEYEAPVQ